MGVARKIAVEVQFDKIVGQLVPEGLPLTIDLDLMEKRMILQGLT